MIKFGKPSQDVLNHKAAFFTDNDIKLSDFKKLFNLYVRQPRRIECKNCCHPLGEPSFQKEGVDYILCARCGHLNGAHEDTNEFCRVLYTNDGGKNYAATYRAETAEDYHKRVNDIYLPKAKFLSEALREQGENPQTIRYVDLGAGSGYFVAALQNAGMTQAAGYETSQTQVELANSMLKGKALRQHDLSDITELAATLDAEVVSLIGVLEHLQTPREVLGALRKNPKVRYLFLSVPLFSPCVFFEIAFSNTVMPRHLAPPHTHLYTESSIDYFCREFGFNRVAEWWFGADAVDLFRNIWVLMNKSSSGAVSLWEKMFKPLIDDIQLAQDKRRVTSEVHMLLKIKGH